MTMTRRAEMMLATLTAGGVPPARAGQVVDRLSRISKRKRQSKVPRIDRNREAVLSARFRLKSALEKFFPRAARNLAKQVTKARKKLGKSDDAAGKLNDQVDTILGKLDFSLWKELQSDIADIMISITQDGVGVGFNQIGFDPSADITDQVNTKAVAWARERSAELVGMTFNADGELVENPNAEMAITDSTRDMLRSSIARAIEEGTSTADFADELRDEYAFSADRAELIATFEIAQADVEGNLIAYRDSGVVVGKEVILGSEHDDEDECDEAAALGVVPLDDDFDGNGDPPFHPRCVCDVLPVLAGEDD